MKEAKNALTVAKKMLATADKIVLAFVKIVCVACFSGLFLLALANVLIRINPFPELKFSLHFFDEIQVWMLGAMIFYGAAGLWILRDHFRVDDVAKIIFWKSRAARGVANLFIELASLFFICIFTWACYYQSVNLMGETNYLRVPEKYVYLSALLVPGVIMDVYSFRNVAVCVRDLVRAGRTEGRKEERTPAP